MNVKLQIKEVKEEKRPLTIGETCMISVSREDIFSRPYRDKVQTELDCMGFVDYVEYDRTCGFFRTETIRDATPEEVIAWQCIVSYNHCMTAPGLSVCSKSPGGYCCGWFCYHDRLKSYKLLRGKEVILSLTEESI